MKRKNLRQAVVLGLVLASFGSCVWAAEINFNEGINFNTGGFADKIDSDVVNGEYHKDYGSDNLMIKNAGIAFLNYNEDKHLNFSLTTNGDITIYKKNVSPGLGAIATATAGITMYANGNLNGYIHGNNISIENLNTAHDGTLSGIFLGTNWNYNTNYQTITADGDITIKNFDVGINVDRNSELTLNANKVVIDGKGAGSDAIEQSGIYMEVAKSSDATKNSNLKMELFDDLEIKNMQRGISFYGNMMEADIHADNILLGNDDSNYIGESGFQLMLTADNNSANQSDISVSADNDFIVRNFKNGLVISNDINNTDGQFIGSNVDITAGNIYIESTELGISGSGNDNKLVVTANNQNYIIGGTDAVTSSKGANVDITGADNFIGNTANGTGTLAEQERHALYASNAGSINVTANGGMNTIVSDGYRTIHAEGGKDGISQIDITGSVDIVNKNYGAGVTTFADEGLSKIALVASADENESAQNANGGVINIDFAGTTTERTGITEADYKGEYAGGNRIRGSIIAGHNGIININTSWLNENMSLKADTSGIRGSISVYGNVMAGNKGELNLDLGNGGYLEGRVDDYQDAAIKDVNESHGAGFYNPEFSKEITDRGEVNLTLGDKAYWNVTGQSWVSSLTATGAGAVIDMVGEDNGTHAVTIENMQGNANFKMSLNGETKTDSDMLYMKHAEGSYNIYLDRIVTDSEIGEDGLRFATVGDGSSADFKVFASDKGFFDKEYTVGREEYVKGDSENSDYNGDSLDNRKPGEEAVDNYFDGTYTEGITTLVDNTDGLLDKDTNFKLVGSSSEISDGGETILNMSRANYSNAVYMDRLNKRLGEARYIDGDEGIWMRLRHDRIGKQDDFRSMNTMYEIGYDRKADVDNGQRRIGIAGDYMQGSTEYTGVSGSGEIKRIGLWAYDTWLGDKGHYTDYVVKWGHLSNDFNLFRNEKISGDYSNDVFSVSAEYGKKNDIGSDWYFEPQAQLQYAYVTDAQYSSSQGTEVDVDSIHSLIARGGFRIGKDFGSDKKSTVYFKADIMHEFLGDQDIAVRDSSTDGRWTTVGYGNEGTWFDVGFGFAAQTGDNSYVYLDLEQSFGNDNEDTYQINAGMQWSF